MSAPILRMGLALLPLILAPAPAAAAPKAYTVVMEKMKFGPVPAGIKAGDIILWVNRDVVRHTATARDGSFNIDLPGRAAGRTVVNRAGTIPFYCKYHPAMKGQMTVSK